MKHLSAQKITAALIAVSFLFIAQSYAQVSVIMQHGDLKRTGWMYREKTLNQSNVNPNTFGKIFTRTVDDQVYAQPLVVSNLKIANKNYNVVFAATVNNSVYAFDAETPSANTPLWQVNLTPSGYRPVRNKDITGGFCGLLGGYKDFSGNMGIVGTPAIDTITKTLYVVARSVTTTNPKTFVQYLHAIDITTGAEKPNSPVYITATVDGNGGGSVNGKITFDQLKQNQRPGLLLYKGVLYISWASHCDWGPYHGWVLGYDVSTMQLKYIYNNTPEGNAAGIWMSGQAPAVDDNGNIYISTGNGDVGRNGNANDTINRGESLLKLSTKSGNLKVVDFFTPSNYQQLNNGDLDYGVDGVMLIPQTDLSLSGSKEAVLYLINNNAMGGTTTDNSNVVQAININKEGSGDHHLHGSPVYFLNYNKKEYVYAWSEGGLLKQIPFDRKNKIFDTANIITALSDLPPGMPGAFLAVSSDKIKGGTGILWASHPLEGDANHNVVPGILQAFDAGDVTHELWNSNQNPARDSVGRFAKFVVPTVANGKVYLATFSNQLAVYGLLPNAVAETVNYTLDVFPNPARNQVTIKYDDKSGIPQKAVIELSNYYGQVIYKQDVALTAGENMIRIDLPASVKTGTYLLQLTNAKGEIRMMRLSIEK